MEDLMRLRKPWSAPKETAETNSNCANRIITGFKQLDEKGDGATYLFEIAFRVQAQNHGCREAASHERRQLLSSAVLSSMLMGISEFSYTEREMFEEEIRRGIVESTVKPLRVSQEFMDEVQSALQMVLKDDPKTFVVLKELLPLDTSLTQAFRYGFADFYRNRHAHHLC